MGGRFGGASLMLGAAIFWMATAALAADPPSRQRAIAAADGQAPAPEKPEAGVPVCVNPPASGEKIAGDMQLSSDGHSVQIDNGGGGDALVKIRHADTGKLAASFFLRTMESMTIEGVPDGVYRIQYAFGPSLAPDCKSFTRIIRANEMPDVDDMKTQVIDDDEHTEVKHSSVAYQLSVSESGNVKPVKIDAAAFNAE